MNKYLPTLRFNRAVLRIFAGLFIAPAATSGLALDLVRDGRPVATVVTGVSLDLFSPGPGRPAGIVQPRSTKNPDEVDEAAAVRLLVEWLKKITAADVPIAATAPESGVAIYVGRAALAAGLRVDDIVSPTREGLRIIADGQRVLIGGQGDAATYRAVARFLEELGCRCFMDGPLGEVFPQSKTLSIAPMAITEKPGLLWRNPKGPSWRISRWRQWNGAGGHAIQTSHAWGSYLPKDLFDQHPDWFALGLDGQRRRGDWLCTSNQELRAYFAGRVSAAIAGGNLHPSISPPDGRGYCECATCRAQDDPRVIEPSSGTISISSRYVDFFDDVARRVASAHPDSILSFYCYADYTQPPLTPRKLSPNLCAMIAPIRYCRLHEIGHAGCPTREQARTMITGWAAVATRLGYYSYMYNLADATLPFFKFTACREEIPWLQQQGLSHLTMEVVTNWYVYGPQIHLGLRLAYDPQADAAAIMDDYWLKFYGPRAAPWMQQYWMGIDAAQGRLKTHAGSFFGLQQIYSPAFVEECSTRLKQATEAARADPIYAQRVALHASGFQNVVDYRQICEAMESGDFGLAKTTLEIMTERIRIAAAAGWANPEYGTAYLDRYLKKTVLAGAALTAAPHRLLQVLPEKWRLAIDPEDQGNDRGWPRASFDDSHWSSVSTHRTLDGQGFDQNSILWYRNRFSVSAPSGKLLLFFAEVDGGSEVYINGEKIALAPEFAERRVPPVSAVPIGAGPKRREGMAKAREPFSVDITAAVKPGENTIALRVDHTKITELALGGILRPILLITKSD